MWNVYQFCTHVDLICVPNLQIEDQLVLTWKRWGGAGVGVYRAAGQELCFPAEELPRARLRCQSSYWLALYSACDDGSIGCCGRGRTGGCVEARII